MILARGIKAFYGLPFWQRALLYLGGFIAGDLLVGLAAWLKPSWGSTATAAFAIAVLVAFGVSFYRWGLRQFLVRPPISRTVRLPRGVTEAAVPFLPNRRELPRANPLAWLWPGRVLIYDLARPPEEVLGSIGAGLCPEGVLDSLRAPGQLRGFIQGSHVRLVVAVPLLENGFGSIFDGQAIPTGGGTRLAGVLRMRAYTRSFLVIWFLLAFGLGIPMFISTIVYPRSWYPSPPPAALPLLFPFFGVAVLVVGRLIARFQERLIIRGLDAALGIGSSTSR